jgi:exopolysaccharide biosynthesis polyprenyl glycosylphosphotransferase
LALVEVMRESEWSLRQPAKRLFDVVASTFLLLLSGPLLLLAALAIKLSSPGPVIYRQIRVGVNRKPFTLLKLRTMNLDAEKESGEVLASKSDPRVTPAGRFLRWLRLDELPQLLNVLVGEMSLVGPRPERPGFVRQYLEHIPGYAERFSVKPGLTGLAQVTGDYHTSAANKLRYDLAYQANASVWFDLSILFRTVKIVLSRPGS